MKKDHVSSTSAEHRRSLVSYYDSLRHAPPPPSPIVCPPVVRDSLGWADGHPHQNHDCHVRQRYVLGEIVFHDMSIQLSAAVWRDLTSSFFQWEGASVVRELVRK